MLRKDSCEKKQFIPFFILLSTVVIGGCNSDDINKIRQKYPNLSKKELWDRRESLEKGQNQENIAESEKTSHISDKIEADILYYRNRFLRTDSDNIPPETPTVEKKVHFNLEQNKYYDPDQSQNMNPESDEEEISSKKSYPINEAQALRQREETSSKNTEEE